MSKIWSHPTWKFFHIFAENVNESFYNRNKDICLQIIKTICGILPCPYCKSHASNYMKHIHIQHLPTKKHFIDMLLTFHNKVNSRLHKPQFPKKNLIQYKGLDIVRAVDIMCHKLKSFDHQGLFKMKVLASDYSVLDNIQNSIRKHKRFFL